MTSKFTREELLNIIETDHVQCGEASALARMALAAMGDEPHTDDELSNLLWYSQEATCHSNPNYYCEFERLATPGFIAWIVRELQERRKADSEPVAVTDDMAYEFHHALTDSMIGSDDVEEIKTGLRAVFANLTAPVASDKCPERLPCSVLLEPGLRFGKGIKTSAVLAALARRAVYESEMSALSPEEKAEFQAKIADFKALIAQPAPVVQENSDPRDAFEAVFPMPKHAQRCGDGYAVTSYGAWTAYEFVKKWEGWNACRSAMLQESPKSAGASNNCRSSENVQDLQAGNSPVIGIDPASGPDRSVEVRHSAPPGYVMVPKEPTPEILATITEAIRAMRGSAATYARVLAAAKHDAPALNSLQSVDSVAGKWIPVGERMPGSQEWVIVFAKWANQQVLCWDDVQNRWTDFEDQSYYADMFSHWMPLPAAPQEVK